jgi:hypothetical protein
MRGVNIGVSQKKILFRRKGVWLSDLYTYLNSTQAEEIVKDYKDGFDA